MSRNLFVCHTQANLILAIGLSKGRFIHDENDLILFTDFQISEVLEKALNTIFKNKLYLSGSFPQKNKSWKSKFKRYQIDFKKINKFMDTLYNRVFEVCDDALPEIFILKKAKSINPSAELIWLEDGSHPYFINGFQNTGLNSNDITRYIRKFIFRYIFMFGKFYDFEGGYMGSNRNLKIIYLTYPGNERKEYANKIKETITDEEYRLGIKYLYSGNVQILDDDSTLLVLDKLDSYKNLDRIKILVNSVYEWCKNNNKLLCYKLHPKEDVILAELDGLNELNKNIAIEYFYASNINKKITIIGVKSTGLQASKKLGFKTISTMKLVGEEEINVSKFYNKIDIITPNSYEILYNEIQQ